MQSNTQTLLKHSTPLCKTFERSRKMMVYFDGWQYKACCFHHHHHTPFLIHLLIAKPRKPQKFFSLSENEIKKQIVPEHQHTHRFATGLGRGADMQYWFDNNIHKLRSFEGDGKKGKRMEKRGKKETGAQLDIGLIGTVVQRSKCNSAKRPGSIQANMKDMTFFHITLLLLKAKLQH